MLHRYELRAFRCLYRADYDSCSTRGVLGLLVVELRAVCAHYTAIAVGGV